MILWPGAAILWAGPAAPWAGTASMWAGTAALEAARTDSRCSQTLPGTPRSSQELPEAARSWKKRFLAGFRGRCGGGSRRPATQGVGSQPMLPPPKTLFFKRNHPYKPGQGTRNRICIDKAQSRLRAKRGGGYKKYLNKYKNTQNIKKMPQGGGGQEKI